MRCIICDLEKDESKEHIIPEAMGNSKLITYKVCEECNNKLGSKVDKYLTDYILGMLKLYIFQNSSIWICLRKNKNLISSHIF